MEAATADRTAKVKTLPKKQRRVYDLLVKGMNANEVARRMKISPNGVYGHMRRIEEHGVDLSQYRSHNGSSKNAPRATTTRRRRRRTANNHSPAVEHTLKVLDGEEATLKGEAEKVEFEIKSQQVRLNELGTALGVVSEAKDRIASARK